MTDTPRVAVIGLDCGTPQLLFRDFEAETPEHPRADAARDVGRPGEHHAADHRPRVGVRHDRQDARAARHLRVPQPQGHELRGPVDRDLGRREGARGLGRLGGQGSSFAPDRRPAVVPAAEGVPRLAGRVLPHASLGEVLGLPGGARDRDRGELGDGNDYIFDIPDFRRAGYDVVLDQVFRMTERRFQVGRQLAQDKPWDFFMLCEIAPDRLHHVFWQHWDPRHPAVRAGQQVRDGVPGLLPVPRRSRSARCSRSFPRTRSRS